MPAIPPVASAEDCRPPACDKVVIQTYEGDLDTMTLRLTATIVTSVAELRARTGDLDAAA